MAFGPSDEWAPEIGEDRADQKWRQNRPEEMQQGRDYDRGDYEPQVVHGPQTPRLNRDVGRRHFGHSIGIGAWRSHFR